MPREPPVTSATLPASCLSRVVPDMVISPLEFLVPFGTMKVYGAGDAGQGPTTFFRKGDRRALRKPTARAVVEAIFSGFVRMQRDRDEPRGCLVVSGALACGEEAEMVRRELARLRQAIVTAFRERFERAVQDGDLPAGTDCATLARYTATVLNGLAVQSASGATAKELRLVSALAMQAWPS